MTSQLKAPVCWSSEVEDQLNTPRLLLYWATKTQKALSRASDVRVYLFRATVKTWRRNT